jgi:prophage maintenance system killer protein
MVMYVFVEINGYCLPAPEVEAADIMLRLAAGQLDDRGLSAWLKANSAPCCVPD